MHPFKREKMLGKGSLLVVRGEEGEWFKVSSFRLGWG